jgi:hypothetical protein
VPQVSSICVYCSSSDAVAAHFFGAAEDLGRELAARSITLVFGGCNVGMMGALAGTTKKHGGRVVGVIPRHIAERGLGYEAADELVVTDDLRERKAIMETRADAFIALPGGIGTLEEVLEVMAQKQLRQHSKPIVLINTANYFAPLVNLLEHAIAHKFMRAESRDLYHVVPNVPAIFGLLAGYVPPEVALKWLRKLAAGDGRG